jgi:hypothetical protein
MTLFEKFKKASVEQIAMYIQAIWRHSATIGICLGLVWGMSVKIVKPYAQEAVIEMMKEAGVDPEAFKGLVKDAQELTRDNDMIRGDLAKVKQQNEQQIKIEIENSTEREFMQKQLDRVEANVDKLVDVLIERKKAEASP